MLCAFDAAPGFNRVTRLYGRTESYIVKPCVDGKFTLLHRILHQYTGGLSQDLTEDHARNDGKIGKMSLEEEFVTADGIMSDGSSFPVFHIIQEQHGFSVRKYRHDLFSVHILISLSLSIYPYSFILALLFLFLYPCAFVFIPLSLRFCPYSFILALLSLFLCPYCLIPISLSFSRSLYFFVLTS